MGNGSDAAAVRLRRLGVVNTRIATAANEMNKLFVGAAISIALSSAAFGAGATANWLANCASCHGKDGSGNTAMGHKLNTKNYRDPKFQVAFSDAELENAIKKGVKTNGKQTMKPFGDKFSEADIKALVAYIRSFAKS